MEIRVLKYFLTVARMQSINRAAESLHITQPTLSRQLAALERELGVTLFERGAKRVTLTDEGLLLRRRAEEILALAEKTEQELKTPEDRVEGKITIGCGELRVMRRLTAALDGFGTLYPLVRYELVSASADVVKEQMDRGIIDIGVLVEPVELVDCDYLRFPAEEKTVVFMRADDPLAAKACLTAEELSRLPLILPSRLTVQSGLANWFGPYYNELDIRFTGNLGTNCTLLVHAGLGYSLGLEGSVPFQDDRQIASVPISPALYSDSFLMWKRDLPQSRALQKLTAYLKGMYA